MKAEIINKLENYEVARTHLHKYAKELKKETNTKI